MAKKSLTASVYTFENLRRGNFLYVDKTEFLWKLVEPHNAMYFLSRPRRFGKSLTVSTLKAIFEGKKELFKGLAIYDKPYDWKKYPVIHLDFNGRDFNTVESLEKSLRNIVAEQARTLNVTLPMEDAVTMFQNLIGALSKDTQVVVLVDEYDKPILNNITELISKELLRHLKPFFSVIKEREDVIRFAFVTGVTKFCHVSLFSDLNNLTDITMNADYATMLGYTQQEFEQNFAEWIAETETKQELPHDEYLDKIKDWYDGYCFHAKTDRVYNPVSLANFFTNNGEFQNYWFATGTPSFLMELIKRDRMDLEKVLSTPVTSYAFGAFEIDNIPPLTLLLQTGYLTISSTENTNGRLRYRLDFPNREVAESFNVYLLNAYSRKSQNDVATFCDALADALIDGDLSQFQKVMEAFFAGIPYDVHRKDESNFQNIFYAIFRLLGYNAIAESRTSDGRIDAVVETERFIYLFEFKLNRDKSALKQIMEKEYFKRYLLHKQQIILVGVNFDTETGKLSDWQHEELQR